MPIKTLLGLILCNVIWSLNPSMGKFVLEDFHPVHTALIRYGGALLVYVLAISVIRWFGPRKFRSIRGFMVPRTPADIALVVGFGLVTFCLSPVFQMSGLHASRATDGALIVAMEPLAAVVLAAIFLREGLTRLHVFAFALAILGFSMLAQLTPSRLSEGLSPDTLGNLAILASIVGEGSSVVFGRKLVAKHSAVSIFGSALLVGVVLMWTGALLAPQVPPFEVASFTIGSAFGALWLGPLGTTATYLFWMIVLPYVSVASISLTLFVQPLLGAVWGYWFLSERLTPLQGAGGFLILIAVFSQTLRELSRQRSAV